MAATFCGISGYACVVEKLQTAQETALKGTLSNTELNDNGMLCILTELKGIWEIIMIPRITILNHLNNISDKAAEDNLDDTAIVETVDVNSRQEIDSSQPE